MPFVKGKSGNPDGRPQGSLNKETLTKLERRSIFEEEVSAMWRDKIKELRPEYIADQFMGKATDKIELSGEVDTSGGLTPELIAEAKRLLKEKLIKPKNE